VTDADDEISALRAELDLARKDLDTVKRASKVLSLAYSQERAILHAKLSEQSAANLEGLRAANELLTREIEELRADITYLRAARTLYAQSLGSDDGCCHKTRLKDGPCPVGRKCPHIDLAAENT
jgi:chromosome segregation ATPase